MTTAILNSDGFATTAGTVTAYSFKPDTGELVSQTSAYVSLHAGIPANCTLISPPNIQKGYARVFNDGKWQQIEDHRKEVVYDVKTAQSFEIKELGAIPEGYTEQKPPQLTEAGQTLSFDGSKWEIIEAPIKFQAQTKFSTYSLQCTVMCAIGKFPSAAAIAYGKSLYNIINSKEDTSAGNEEDEVTIPNPPPGDMNDPSSSWWS